MTVRGAALLGKSQLIRLILKKVCPHFITLLMCFISFGPIIGSIDVSDARGGACMSVVYRRCVNKKNDEKGYFFRAGQCAVLSSFRVGKMLFL